MQLSKGPNGEDIVEHKRRPDGIWYGPPDGRPQNTRLSGVLALMKIAPWNFASKTGQLIPNPWAEKPLPDLTLGTAELVVVGDGYERKEGKSIHELVGFLPIGRKSDAGAVAHSVALTALRRNRSPDADAILQRDKALSDIVATSRVPLVTNLGCADNGLGAP